MNLTSIFRKIILLALVVSFIACEKENADKIQQEVDDVKALHVEQLVEVANWRYMSVEVSESREGFVVPNDGLIDEYTATERGYQSIEKQGQNRFLSCLRSVEPDQDQVFNIRRVLRLYESRNERIIINHRRMFSQLQEHMRTQARELNRLYINGRIDEETYRQRRTALSERYQEALHRIREQHAEAFSRSYRLLLQQLRPVLTEEQWADFSTCIGQ